jgi:hypothetical protein
LLVVAIVVYQWLVKIVVVVIIKNWKKFVVVVVNQRVDKCLLLLLLISQWLDKHVLMFWLTGQDCGVEIEKTRQLQEHHSINFYKHHQISGKQLWRPKCLIRFKIVWNSLWRGQTHDLSAVWLSRLGNQFLWIKI